MYVYSVSSLENIKWLMTLPACSNLLILHLATQILSSYAAIPNSSMPPSILTNSNSFPEIQLKIPSDALFGVSNATCMATYAVAIVQYKQCWELGMKQLEPNGTKHFAVCRGEGEGGVVELNQS